MHRISFLFILLFVPCNAFAKTPDKWEGYIEFTGKPGTARSLGLSDVFVPLWQDKNDMSFFNLRGMTENFDYGEFNIGLGHRHIFDDYIIGAYAYWDNSEAESGFNYRQWAVGLEMLGDKWDVRVNGYIPYGQTNEVFSSVDTTADVEIVGEENQPIWVDYTQTDVLSQERSLPGFDMEVGYKLPILEDTRLYLGGYHFIGKDGFESVSGPRARLETRLYDLPYMGLGSRLMAGLEFQTDDARGGQTAGIISIRIPFGFVSKNQKAKLKGLDRRMMEPVVRDVDIVTTQKTTKTFQQDRSHALNPEGLAYTRVMVVDSAESMNEINEAANELVTDGEVPLVLIKKDGANSKLEIGEDALIGGTTFALAGKFLKVDYFNSIDGVQKTVAFTPEGETPELELLSKQNWAIGLADRSHINGFDIDAANYRRGALITQEGDYYISNSSFFNAALGKFGDGIKISSDANNVDINVYIEDSQFFGNYQSGILALGSKVYAEISNSEFYDNENGININSASVKADNIWAHDNESGVYAQGGSQFELSNSEFYDNDYGIYSISASVIKADNIWVHNNKGGVHLEGDSRFEVSNSEFYDNENGIFLIKASAEADNIRVRNSMVGVYLDRESQFEISNSVLSSNTHHGLYVLASNAQIDNVLFEYNGEEAEWGSGLKIAWEGNAYDTTGGAPVETIVTNSIFRHNGIGINQRAGSKLTIENSLIERNLGDGISVDASNGRVSDFTIKDSSVLNNGEEGINLYSLVYNTSDVGSKITFLIDNVTIAGNGRNGIVAQDQVVGTIKNSRIYDNQSSGIYTISSGGAAYATKVDEFGQPILDEDGEPIPALTLFGEQSDIYIDNVEIYGNGSYGIRSGGNHMTVTNSSVHDNQEGSYINQTGLDTIYDGYTRCILDGGFLSVDGDGGDIPETVLSPITTDHLCKSSDPFPY